MARATQCTISINTDTWDTVCSAADRLGVRPAAFVTALVAIGFDSFTDEDILEAEIRRTSNDAFDLFKLWLGHRTMNLAATVSVQASLVRHIADNMIRRGIEPPAGNFMFFDLPETIAEVEVPEAVHELHRADSYRWLSVWNNWVEFRFWCREVNNPYRALAEMQARYIQARASA